MKLARGMFKMNKTSLFAAQRKLVKLFATRHRGGCIVSKTVDGRKMHRELLNTWSSPLVQEVSKPQVTEKQECFRKKYTLILFLRYLLLAEFTDSTLNTMDLRSNTVQQFPVPRQ